MFYTIILTYLDALKPAMFDSKIFFYLCPNETLSNATSCVEQEQAMDHMFAISGGTVNASGYFVGILLDLFHRRVMMFGSGLFWGACCLLFAFSSESFPAYTPSFVGMTVAGLGMFFSGISYANPTEAPGWEGFVAGLLTAMWDTSSVIFYLFNLIYFAGVSLKWIFFSYSTVAIAIMIFAIFMNGGTIQEIHDFVIRCKNKTLCQVPKWDPEKTHRQRVMAVIYYIFPYSDIFHLELWASYAYCACAILHSYLYMATLRRQLALINDYDKQITETQITVFSILLPALGTVAAVVMGKVKDLLGGAAHASRSFWLLVPFNVVLLACMLIKNSGLQYFTMVVFVCWRIMFFVLMNAFIPAAPYYSPASKFKLLSIGYLIGGLLTTFTIKPIDDHITAHVGGDFFWVNVGLGTATIVMNILCGLAVFRKERIFYKILEQEVIKFDKTFV
jgi:MFS family permease